MAKLQGKDKELADKMNALLLEYGYKSTRYFVSHDATTARFTINTLKPTAEGKVMTAEDKYAADYKKWCLVQGFKPEWIGISLQYGGTTSKLVGFLVKSRSVKVVLGTPRGLRVAPTDAVKACIGRTTKNVA